MCQARLQNARCSQASNSETRFLADVAVLDFLYSATSEPLSCSLIRSSNLGTGGLSTRTMYPAKNPASLKDVRNNYTRTPYRKGNRLIGSSRGRLGQSKYLSTAQTLIIIIL